jgi:hypothetical protein
VDSETIVGAGLRTHLLEDGQSRIRLASISKTLFDSHEMFEAVKALVSTPASVLPGRPKLL